MRSVRDRYSDHERDDKRNIDRSAQKFRRPLHLSKTQIEKHRIHERDQRIDSSPEDESQRLFVVQFPEERLDFSEKCSFFKNFVHSSETDFRGFSAFLVHYAEVFFRLKVKH